MTKTTPKTPQREAFYLVERMGFEETRAWAQHMIDVCGACGDTELETWWRTVAELIAPGAPALERPIERYAIERTIGPVKTDTLDLAAATHTVYVATQADVKAWVLENVWTGHTVDVYRLRADGQYLVYTLTKIDRTRVKRRNV